MKGHEDASFKIADQFDRNYRRFKFVWILGSILLVIRIIEIWFSRGLGIEPTRITWHYSMFIIFLFFIPVFARVCLQEIFIRKIPSLEQPVPHHFFFGLRGIWRFDTFSFRKLLEMENECIKKYTEEWLYSLSLISFETYLKNWEKKKVLESYLAMISLLFLMITLCIWLLMYLNTGFKDWLIVRI